LNRLKPKSKAQEDLVAVATKHWNSVNAKEVDTVAYFLYAVKHRRKYHHSLWNMFFFERSIFNPQKEVLRCGSYTVGSNTLCSPSLFNDR